MQVALCHSFFFAVANISVANIDVANIKYIVCVWSMECPAALVAVAMAGSGQAT